MRIQALEKEVQQTYLSGIGEDAMDSGDNPMMTKIYSGAIIVDVGALSPSYLRLARSSSQTTVGRGNQDEICETC